MNPAAAFIKIPLSNLSAVWCLRGKDLLPLWENRKSFFWNLSRTRKEKSDCQFCGFLSGESISHLLPSEVIRIQRLLFLPHFRLSRALHTTWPFPPLFTYTASAQKSILFCTRAIAKEIRVICKVRASADRKDRICLWWILDSGIFIKAAAGFIENSSLRTIYIMEFSFLFIVASHVNTQNSHMIKYVFRNPQAQLNCPYDIWFPFIHNGQSGKPAILIGQMPKGNRLCHWKGRCTVWDCSAYHASSFRTVGMQWDHHESAHICGWKNESFSKGRSTFDKLANQPFL